MSRVVSRAQSRLCGHDNDPALYASSLADLNYTYSFGRSKISYQYGPGISLGLTPTQIALAGNGLSDLTFLQNVLEARLVPINKTVAARSTIASRTER
jgi:hypothetical protein